MNLESIVEPRKGSQSMLIDILSCIFPEAGSWFMKNVKGFVWKKKPGLIGVAFGRECFQRQQCPPLKKSG